MLFRNTLGVLPLGLGLCALVRARADHAQPFGLGAFGIWGHDRSDGPYAALLDLGIAAQSLSRFVALYERAVIGSGYVSASACSP